MGVNSLYCACFVRCVLCSGCRDAPESQDLACTGGGLHCVRRARGTVCVNFVFSANSTKVKSESIYLYKISVYAVDNRILYFLIIFVFLVF
jgi:hypothetical protein